MRDKVYLLVQIQINFPIMKHFYSAFFLIFLNFNLIAQARTISGKVISENFEIMAGAIIMDKDSLTIGNCDLDGRFEIKIPKSTNRILINWVGTEWSTINLKPNCENVEVILMWAAIYDFITIDEINRLRLKRFKKLKRLHKKAFEKGIFTTKEACYGQQFFTAKI